MRKIKFLAMAAVTTIFASCSNKEDVLQPTSSLKDTPINVNVLMSEIQTRAGYDANNLPTMFYLSIDQTGESYDYYVVMKHENSSWVAYESADESAVQKQLLWEGSEGNVTVTAATFPLSDAAAYTLSAATEQTTANAVKASDHLCYYSNAIKPSTSGISIAFSHIMSKVEITVKLRDEYEGVPSPITSVALIGTSANATYHPAQTTSKWTVNQSTASITPFLINGYSEATRTATYEAILIPQEIAASTFGVEILIGETTFRWTSANEVTLTEGTKYTLELTVGKDKVSNASFTASEWETGENINNKTE